MTVADSIADILAQQDGFESVAATSGFMADRYREAAMRMLQSDSVAPPEELARTAFAHAEWLVARLAKADAALAEHSQCVAALAARCAVQMGWDEDRVTMAYFAGLLHEVGSILVPPAAEDAWPSEVAYTLAKMRCASVELLSQTEALAPLAPIVSETFAETTRSPIARLVVVCDAAEWTMRSVPGRPAATPDAVFAAMHAYPVRYEPFYVEMVRRAVQRLTERSELIA